MDKLLVLLTSWGPLGVLGIAALDSAGVPLPAGVDALLIAVAILSPPEAYFTAILATAGSIAGNLFLFSVARKGGETYLRQHTASRRARKLRQWFQQYGLITVFIPAFVPIVPLPLKVFVVSAGALGVSRKAFLLTIVAARAPRYISLAYLGSQLGENSLQWLQDHALHLAAVAVGMFVFLYLLVRFAGSEVETAN